MGSDHLSALQVVYLDNFLMTRFSDKKNFPSSWNLGDIPRSVTFEGVADQIYRIRTIDQGHPRAQ